MGPGVTSPVRVVVLGMPCAFTRTMLDGLLHDATGAVGIDLVAVVLAVPDADESFGMDRPAGFRFVPDATPMVRLGSRSTLADPAWLARLQSFAPDVIVAGCFPWRLPEAVLAVPRFGCLNVHPSLLPNGRGPEPLFWAFRWRLRETGVTVHRMDPDLDTGPIHAQATVPIADDATLLSLERELASRGRALVRRVIGDLAQGTAAPLPQSGPPSPWARFPGADDLRVSTAWTAVDAARFIRAVSPVFGRVDCLVLATGQRDGQGAGWGFDARDVIAIEEDGEQVEPVVRTGETISIRFTSGTIRFRMATGAAPLTLHPRR